MAAQAGTDTGLGSGLGEAEELGDGLSVGLAVGLGEGAGVCRTADELDAGASGPFAVQAPMAARHRRSTTPFLTGASNEHRYGGLRPSLWATSRPEYAGPFSA